MRDRGRRKKGKERRVKRGCGGGIASYPGSFRSQRMEGNEGERGRELV